MGEGVTLSYRDYQARQSVFSLGDFKLPVLSDALKAQATTTYTAHSNDPFVNFLERAEGQERGLPNFVYPRQGYNWGTAAYFEAQLGGYDDELGDGYTFLLGQGGLALVAHQTPAAWTGFLGFAASGSIPGDSDTTEETIDPYYSHGGHRVRGVIEGGVGFNMLGLPATFFEQYKVPHSELINGIYPQVLVGYGTGRSNAYSDEFYTAGTGMVQANVCLVGLDEMLGLCFGNNWILDQYKWQRGDQTEGGWKIWSIPTVTLQGFATVDSREYIPIVSRMDRPVNADIPNNTVIQDSVYRGELSNALQFTVVDYHPKDPDALYEYIQKVARDEDTDGVPEGLLHWEEKTEGAKAEDVLHWRRRIERGERVEDIVQEIEKIERDKKVKDIVQEIKIKRDEKVKDIVSEIESTKKVKVTEEDVLNWIEKIERGERGEDVVSEIESTQGVKVTAEDVLSWIEKIEGVKVPKAKDILSWIEKIERGERGEDIVREIESTQGVKVTAEDVLNWMEKIKGVKVPKAEDMLHWTEKIEEFEKVRKATIIFSYEGQDLAFELLKEGSPGAGSANAVSALNREITLHAGANWAEWFVYKGFVYQLVMNTEPEKLVIQSFPVEPGSPYAGKEEAVIFRGTARSVQRK